MKKYWILSIVYLHALQSVFCDGVLYMKLKEYKNPSHEKNDQKCCNKRTSNCRTSCVNTITVSISSPSLRNCTLTVVGIDDDASFINQKNSQLECPFEQWQGGFTFDASVFHIEHGSTPTSRVQVTSLSGPISMSAFDYMNKNWTEKKFKYNPYKRRRGKEKTITVDIRVSCDHGYLPPDCAKQSCTPRDDHSGHYTCDKNNKKICLKGWTDPSSGCVKAVLESSTFTVMSYNTQSSSSFLGVQTSQRTLVETKKSQNTFTTEVHALSPSVVSTSAIGSSWEIFATRSYQQIFTTDIKNAIISSSSQKAVITQRIRNVSKVISSLETHIIKTTQSEKAFTTEPHAISPSIVSTSAFSSSWKIFATRSYQQILTTDPIKNSIKSSSSQKMVISQSINNAAKISSSLERATTHNAITTYTSQRLFTTHAIKKMTTSHSSQERLLTTLKDGAAYSKQSARSVYLSLITSKTHVSSSKFHRTNFTSPPSDTKPPNHQVWKYTLGASLGVILALALFMLLYFRKRVIQKYKVHAQKNDEEHYPKWEDQKNKYCA